MNEVVKFLQSNPIQYLATVGQDNKAKCRPFTFVGEIDEKLWFCTDNQHEAYMDMQYKPWVEFSLQISEKSCMRLNGKAVFEENMEAKKICLSIPLVKEYYKTADNPALAVFYLADAHAQIADMYENSPKKYDL